MTSVVESTSFVVKRLVAPMTADIKLTKFEMEIMGVMWTLGTASVREIQERLPEHKRPAYTTVQTIIYRLEEKGAVRRVKKIGNAHIFEPVITRKAAHRRLIEDLLHMFGGSPRLLMAQLVETGQLTLDDIKELENTLAMLASGKRKNRPSGDQPTHDKRRRRSSK